LAEDSPLAACPAWLTGDAQALWERVAPGAIRIGLLTLVDLPAFEAMCQSYARWREFERLSGDNLEFAIAKGYRNGAVKERQLMLQFGARFGFDPSSRSNVKVPRHQPQSKAERFRAAKSGT
jgi:P27 family predicted phage terminase small subunit